jgi:hypothetical protein
MTITIYKRSPGPIRTEKFAVKKCNDHNEIHSQNVKNQLVPGDWQVYTWMMNFGLKKEGVKLNFSFKRPLKPSTKIEINENGIVSGRRTFLEVDINELDGITENIDLGLFQINPLLPKRTLLEHYCLISGQIYNMAEPILNSYGFMIKENETKGVYTGSNIQLLYAPGQKQMQMELITSSLTSSTKGQNLNVGIDFIFGLYSPRTKKITGSIKKSVTFTKILR